APALAQASHVAGEPMPPLVDEAPERGTALRQVLGAAGRRAVSRARAAPSMDERCVHHRAPPARLPHGEREVAVVSVKEAVALVETAHALERRAPEAETDAVHRRH